MFNRPLKKHGDYYGCKSINTEVEPAAVYKNRNNFLGIFAFFFSHN